MSTLLINGLYAYFLIMIWIQAMTSGRLQPHSGTPWVSFPPHRNTTGGSVHSLALHPPPRRKRLTLNGFGGLYTGPSPGSPPPAHRIHGSKHYILWSTTL